MSGREDIERLSRRLAETDFSADSRIRAGLRAALLKKPARSFRARVAPLALALAAALILALPFRARLHRAGPASTVVSVRLPAAPSPAPAVPPRSPAPEKPAFPRGGLGLPVLPGRLIAQGPSGEEPPISTMTIDRLIDIRQGRVVAGKNGSAVIWELDGAAYILETRRISLNDLFETRAL